MKKKSTEQHRRLKITDEIREAYAKRDKSLDNYDPENPVLPPEAWQNAVVGKFYRPLKTPVTVRIDNDVIAWLRSKGAGHLTRINDILRSAMMTESKR
jgi:uncharacterized protein (DUF4415 family)